MPSSFLEKIKKAEQSSLGTPLLGESQQISTFPTPSAPVLGEFQTPVYTPPQHIQSAGTPPSNFNNNDYNAIYNKLIYAIQNNNLQRFYPYERVVQLSQQISSVPITTLAKDFRISTEVAIDLYQLALYDVVLLADDSGSMAAYEGRIEELNIVTEKVAGVASKFDQDGITLCFLNNTVVRNLASASEVPQIIKDTRFSGTTPLGRALKNKIIEPMVMRKFNQGQLQKPVLVIVLTDGEPDSKEDVYNALKEAKDFNQRVGTNCVEFEFAQIGNDKAAQKFLYDLDTHVVIGDIVDVTSSYEMEEEEFAKAGANLTPYMWIVKLMLGTIDPQYDASDECK